MDVGEQEGWFEPGGWVYELYAKYPWTDDQRAAFERESNEARAAAQASRRPR